MSPFIFFIVSLIFTYTIVKIYKPSWSYVDSFGEYLTKKAFPSDSALEIYKFAILRVLFGLVLTIRAWDIYSYLLPSELYTQVGYLSLINLIACIFVIIGFFTQWAFLMLAFLMWQSAERLLGTSTLGSDIAAMLTLMFFLVGAGKSISVDSLIIKYFKKFSFILLYFNTPNKNRIAIAKFLALFSFWALCTYSLSMHINEPAWTSGVAGPLLLTNNFMSTPFSWFETLFEHSQVSVNIARYSIWLMMLWYITVLPFTLMGGVYRKYVIIWGVLFFILSEFVLNLSALPKIEFIFWAALFWTTAGINSNKKIEVFFDDKCNLCDKTIQFITAVDFFNRVELRPVSLNKALMHTYNISEERALEDLYGVDGQSKQQFFGYDFYVKLTQRIVMLWPILPIMYLGKITKIGPYIYSFIAIRRRRLFGVCTLPRPKTTRSLSHLSNPVNQPWFYSIFYHVLILGFFYLIAIPAPYIGYDGFQSIASKAAHNYGIAPINVFNITDIRMAENWYTIKNITNNKDILLFANNGSRLSMHKSDRIYFGNTLKFRRKFIGVDGCSFSAAEKSIMYLSQVALAKDSSAVGQYTFNYTQYYQPIPDLAGIVKGEYTKHPVSIRCSIDYVVDYNQ